MVLEVYKNVKSDTAEANHGGWGCGGARGALSEHGVLWESRETSTPGLSSSPRGPRHLHR